MSADFERLKKWIGRRESSVDYITVSTVHRLAATLDRDDPIPKLGDPLPSSWYQILCPRVGRHSEIGPDGHPQRGDFLPPVPLPRRMFAGKRTTFHEDLRVGDRVRRDSVIKGITVKQGRSGTMVFVTIKTDFISPRGLAIAEEQDVVYREAPAPCAPPQPAQPAPGNAVWSRRVTPDPVMLFRYSALTFNGHRIHYDKPYVTLVEGYPDLIVNGGLTTLLVFELARAHAARPLRHMTSRNVRVLYVNQPIILGGEPAASNGSAKLWALNPDGGLALSAEAEFR